LNAILSEFLFESVGGFFPGFGGGDKVEDLFTDLVFGLYQLLPVDVLDVLAGLDDVV
jgi:hypothetical protein